MCVVMGMKKRNISRAAFENHMKVTTSRGPDGMRVVQAGDGFLGFQRLSIMGLTEAGMKISGTSPDGHIVEMIEVTGHPYFAATQAHPEFKSRPNKAHPLFRGLIAAAVKRKNG